MQIESERKTETVYIAVRAYLVSFPARRTVASTLSFPRPEACSGPWLTASLTGRQILTLPLNRAIAARPPN